MKTKTVITTAIIVMVIIVVVAFIFAGNSKPNTNTTNTTSSENSQDQIPPTSQSSTISSSDLAQHSSKSDCWVGFQGKVYDITSYVPRHPGGSDKIIPLCGTSSEFEKSFLGQHGTSKIPVLESMGTFKGNLG